MDPFANLHEGVAKIEDVGESIASYIRGLLVQIGASTNDSTVLAMIEHGKASVDTSVNAILANTKDEPQPGGEPSDDDKKAVEDEKKDIAGKPVMVNAVADIDPKEVEDPKPASFADFSQSVDKTDPPPVGGAITAGHASTASNSAPPATASKTVTTSPVATSGSSPAVKK